MIVFALLMLAAGYKMITDKKVETANSPNENKVTLLLYGVLVGLVTGFLGAGGGFLLVPALVLVMRLSMKVAIGTSLSIIALNSLIGFSADLGRQPINWPFLLLITGLAVAGIFIGSYYNKKINARNLKKGFGWFVLAMAIFIIVREVLF
jgi:uncharacterized membrane protein YfcA